MAEPQPPRGERTRMSPETFAQQWAQIRQHLRGWWDQTHRAGRRTDCGPPRPVGPGDPSALSVSARACPGRGRSAFAGVPDRREPYRRGPDRRGRRGGLPPHGDGGTGASDRGGPVPAGSVHRRAGGLGAALPRHLGTDRAGGGCAARPQSRENPPPASRPKRSSGRLCGKRTSCCGRSPTGSRTTCKSSPAC
jgi:hypothetical protein